jgi:hypothetical protein
MKRTVVQFLFIAIIALLRAQPNVTSWQLNTTGAKGKYWTVPGPTLVTMTDSSGITKVCYSSSYVYARTRDLSGAFTMGPKNNPNNPVAQNYTIRFPKTPTQQTGTKTTVPSGGGIGLAVDGVLFYGCKSADSYKSSTNSNGGTGDGKWHCDAWYNEQTTMDTSGNAHSDGSGKYHYHAIPRRLYTYPSTAHSPIIGFAIDGYPIYGPYGYSTATSSTSAVTRMTSSYQLRSISTRTSDPFGNVTTPAGPNVSATFPLGMYTEDYQYVSGSGDLDDMNGRYCVTPDYPSGTYAYFLTVDNAGSPAFPYLLAYSYYGVITAGDAGPNFGLAGIPTTGVTCVSATTAGAALNFDGSNDRISVPNSTSLNFGTGDFTVEAYFKSSVSQSNYSGIVVKAGTSSMVGFQLVVYGNKIAAEFGSSSVMLGVSNGLVGTTTITDGNWHHLAMVVTRSQNKIELMVDGNIEASVVNSNISTMNVTVSQPLLIGVERTSVAHINGNIDEVRLWNVARTQCEINTYKNCEISTVTTGLVANYDFNQGIDASSNSTETSLTDDSGNSNNGTLTNFALTGTTSNWFAPGAITSGSTTPASLTPTVTASATSSVICNGQSTTLNGGGASTYTWTGGVTNGTAFSPTSTQSYTVTGTATTGCTSTAVKSITVNPIPAVTANASSSVICNGQSTTLNGSGATTYTWTGGVTNGTAFAPSSTQSYTVTGTTLGCTNTAVQDVTVNAVPAVSASATNSVICNGQSTTLNAGGASTYTWTGGVTNGTAFSPSSTQSYTVTGTSTAGCTNTAVKGITVNPLPSVTASASSSVICNGQSTTLNGGGASTYTWTGGVTNGTSFSPTSTQSYTVTGASTAGCTNTAVQGVTVNTVPVVTASTSNSVICNGQSTTLNGGGASTYTWTSGVTNGTSFSPTSTQSYTVTGASSAGCTNTAVQGVTVNPLPVVTASASNSVICNGQSTTLNGGGASTYTWTGGVTNGTSFSPTSTQSYTVTGTSTAGCTNTAVKGVTVNPVPVVTAAAANSVICNGQSTTLNGGGASTYTWTGGVTNGTSFSPASTQSYTVTGTSTGGCTNTAVQGVTVNPLPVVTAATTNSVMCNGQSTTLNGSGASTYTWTGGVMNGVAFTPGASASYTVTGTNTLTGCTSTNIAVANLTVNPNPTVTVASGAICTGGSFTINPSGASTYTISGGSNVVSPSSTTSYTVTGTSANGCVGTPAVATVSVQSSLTVSVSGPSAICNGQTANLTANGAATYSWNTGASTNTIAPTPTTTTTYSVTGSSGSCNNTTTVTVNVNPNPTVTAVSNTSLICVGQTVSLTASGASTYTWNTSATGATITDSPTTTVTYTVTGANANGCTAMATVQQNVSACTGISVLTSSTATRLYPNPTNGLATLELSEDGQVIIINSVGQVISNEKLPAGSHEINISMHVNGIYFVKVISGSQQQTIKLVKE